MNTPRYVPTCTNDLLKGGDYAVEQNIKIQSHLAGAKDQVEWVRAEQNMEDIDVFDDVSTTAFMINLLVPPSKHLENIRNNFLTPRTVQAHCTFLRTAFSEGDGNYPLSFI